MKKEYIYESCLKEEIKSFLELRASQGHVGCKEDYILYTLDQYLTKIDHSGKDLSEKEIYGWLETFSAEMSVNTRIVYISHYRQFATYLFSLGHSAFIPERPMADKGYVPRIYTPEELIALIHAADNIAASIRLYARRSAVCFAVIIRILIGCGLRHGEVLKLKTADVNLKDGVIMVRHAKGDKDRIIPIHESLSKVLTVYLKCGIPQENGWLFPSKTGGSFGMNTSLYYFNRCLTTVGIEKNNDGRYKRTVCIHCLRHTFAINAFRKLQNEGKDMYDEAPVLSTYMGHDSIYGTEKYLHMAAENSSDILELMNEFNASQGLFPEVDE